MNKHFLIIALCAMLFATCWYDTAHAHVFTEPLNHWVQHYIQSSGGGLYHQGLLYLTDLARDIYFLIISGLICLFVVYKKEYKTLAYCIVSLIVIVGLTTLIKHHVYSPRPIPYNLEHDSFPSGHTMRATLYCGLLLFINELKVTTLSKSWRYFLILIPILVGFSRLGLGRHWLSDVIAAFSLTIGVLLFVHAIRTRGSSL
ncbi:MAG: phosphatase PAP2 family protein [Gammaproteobacteria bacterium]